MNALTDFYFKKSAAAPEPGNTIWAVGGGKGGVGKSFISSSLALCLAKLGHQVTIVDLDLGGANLHTCLGGKLPEESLSDFVSGRVRDLSQLMIKTEIPNLSLISGSNDAVNITEMPPFDKDRLIRGLRQLPAQYVILDLGAGTSVNTLDFFLAADQRLIAVTPEPTAIENAYRFLKASFYREMRVLESELKLEKIVEEAMDSKNRFGIRSPSNLLRCVSEMNPNAGVELQRRMGSLKVQIIINQVRTRQDIEVGTSMASVTRKYFGIQADFVGHIDHDNAVWQSLRKRRPLMVEYPYSSIVGQFLRITKHLAHPQPLRAVV